MNNTLKQEKGVALFLVLGVVLLVTILANIVLSMSLSHGRLTQHQLGRVQAYYAAMAGMNLAMENLRTGTWKFEANPANPIINNCPAGAPCQITPATDPDFFLYKNIAGQDVSTGVRSINIVFCPSGTNCSCLNGAHCSNVPGDPIPIVPLGSLCNPPVKGYPPGQDFCIYSSVEFTTPQ